MPAYNGGDCIDEQQLGPDAVRSGGSGQGGDVVIRISGDTAAQMLFRSNEEVRQLTQVVSGLNQRIEDFEAIVRQRLDAHDGLAVAVETLGARIEATSRQVAILSAQQGQTAQLQGDLGSLRNDLADQGYKFLHLREKMERADAESGSLQSQYRQLQGQLSTAAGEIEQLRARLDRLEASPGWFGGTADRLKSTAERIKRLHLGLGLWVAGLAVTLAVAAASAAVLIYT